MNVERSHPPILRLLLAIVLLFGLADGQARADVSERELTRLQERIDQLSAAFLARRWDEVAEFVPPHIWELDRKNHQKSIEVLKSEYIGVIGKGFPENFKFEIFKATVGTPTFRTSGEGFVYTFIPYQFGARIDGRLGEITQSAFAVYEDDEWYFWLIAESKLATFLDGYYTNIDYKILPKMWR